MTVVDPSFCKMPYTIDMAEAMSHVACKASGKEAAGPDRPVSLFYTFVPEGTPQRAVSRIAWQLALFAVCEGRGLPKETLTRAEGPWGKPYFKERPDICFNISHSGRCIVCALADEPVGVDVQVRTGRDHAKVARRILDEAAYAAYLAAPKREDFFYTRWTLLESRLKRTGEGFSVALDKVTLDGWFSFPCLGEDYYAAVNTLGVHSLTTREVDMDLLDPT